jgi:AcrR family transcriptional regulator
MARAKDMNKREIILQSAKMLFSQKGFFNSSISDIVRETGLPVGTIYTYFKNKEEILRIIIDEGWNELYKRLEKNFLSQDSSIQKLKVLIDEYLPELLNDLDFINILLTEAIDYTKIEEKIESISSMIYTILVEDDSSKIQLGDFSKDDMKTALVVFFLGILNAVKISKSGSIGINLKDILRFIRLTVENTMNIKL